MIKDNFSILHNSRAPEGENDTRINGYHNGNIYNLGEYILESINFNGWFSPNYFYFITREFSLFNEPHTISRVKLRKPSTKILHKLIYLRGKLHARKIDMIELFRPFMDKISKITNASEREKIEADILQYDIRRDNLMLDEEQMKFHQKKIHNHMITLFYKEPQSRKDKVFQKAPPIKNDAEKLARNLVLENIKKYEIKFDNWIVKRDIIIKHKNKHKDTDQEQVWSEKLTRLNTKITSFVSTQHEYFTNLLKNTIYKKIEPQIKAFLKLLDDKIQTPYESNSDRISSYKTSEDSKGSMGSKGSKNSIGTNGLDDHRTPPPKSSKKRTVHPTEPANASIRTVSRRLTN